MMYDPSPKEKTPQSQDSSGTSRRIRSVPKKEEIEQVFLLARVLYKAVLGLHFKRQEQKKSGQVAIF
jgi:hypothetical protein